MCNFCLREKFHTWMLHWSLWALEAVCVLWKLLHTFCIWTSCLSITCTFFQWYFQGDVIFSQFSSVFFLGHFFPNKHWTSTSIVLQLKVCSLHSQVRPQILIVQCIIYGNRTYRLFPNRLINPEFRIVSTPEDLLGWQGSLQIFDFYLRSW